MVILTSHRYRKDLKKCIQRGLDMRKLNKLVDSLLMDVSIDAYPCHPLIGN